MLLKPNEVVMHKTAIGYNEHGQPAFDAGRKIKCRVVRYRKSSVKTSVRADSSASRGRAEEILYDAIVLFDHNSSVAIDDLIVIFGETMRIEVIEPRLNVAGKLDHYETKLNAWQ
jgi:hypothetical protein